jgi:hypothetical protein
MRAFSIGGQLQYEGVFTTRTILLLGHFYHMGNSNMKAFSIRANFDIKALLLQGHFHYPAIFVTWNILP